MSRTRTYFFMGGKKRDGIVKDSRDLIKLRNAEREIDHLRTEDMKKYDGDERRQVLAARRKQSDEIRREAEGIAREFMRREVG